MKDKHGRDPDEYEIYGPISGVECMNCGETLLGQDWWDGFGAGTPTVHEVRCHSCLADIELDLEYVEPDVTNQTLIRAPEPKAEL